MEAPYSGTKQVNRQIFKLTQCVPRHTAPNIALKQAYMSFHSGSAISATTFGACCVRNSAGPILGLASDGERCRLWNTASSLRQVVDHYPGDTNSRLLITQVRVPLADMYVDQRLGAKLWLVQLWYYGWYNYDVATTIVPESYGNYTLDDLDFHVRSPVCANWTIANF